MKNFTEVKKHEGQGLKKAMVDRVAINVKDKIVNILLSADVYERLGSPDYVNLAVGNGPQRGRVLITPAKSGYSVVSTVPKKQMRNGRRAQRRITVAARKVGAPMENTPMTTVPFSMVDEGLIVKVS